MKYPLIKTTVLLGLVYGLLSCGPVNKVSYTWSNNGFKLTNPVTKIFVAALVKNPHVREHLEEEMASSTKAQGYGSEKSRDYFMPNIAEKDPPPVESMMDKIKSLNCELIFTINLVDLLGGRSLANLSTSPYDVPSTSSASYASSPIA